METKVLTPDLSVAVQIELKDIEALAHAGFKTIINNRPDNEAEGQPLSAQLASEAQRLGMTFIEIPVSSTGIVDQNVADFGKALTAADTPVLAFCRTGTRSTTCWALCSVSEHGVEDVIETAKKAGYDLSKSRERLEAMTKR
jgi:sulfide:quinone oxidoreductase